MQVRNSNKTLRERPKSVALGRSSYYCIMIFQKLFECYIFNDISSTFIHISANKAIIIQTGNTKYAKYNLIRIPL